MTPDPVFIYEALWRIETALAAVSDALAAHTLLLDLSLSYLRAIVDTLLLMARLLVAVRSTGELS